LKQHVLFLSFADCNTRFLQCVLCDSVQTAVYLPDDLVFHYGVVCTRMYFIVVGDAHYLRYSSTFVKLMQRSDPNSGPRFRASKQKNLLVTLSEGSDIRLGEAEVDLNEVVERNKQLEGQSLQDSGDLCEAVLWTWWAHRGDLEAVTEVSAFELDARNFEEVVSSYLPVQQAMRVHSKRFVDALNESPDVSDLFNSAEALHHEVRREHRQPGHDFSSDDLGDKHCGHGGSEVGGGDPSLEDLDYQRCGVVDSEDGHPWLEDAAAAEPQAWDPQSVRAETGGGS